MSTQYDRLLEAMPAMAERVNAFESEGTREQALAALLTAFGDGSSQLAEDSDVHEADGALSESNDEPTSSGPRVDSRSSWEQQVVEALPDAHAVAERGGRDAQAMWAIITLFDRGEEATNNTIRKLIEAELGIGAEARTNLASRLQELTPKHVTRKKVGRSYQYSPTRNALQVFKDMDPDE